MEEVFTLIVSMSPYLLLGFFLAGILHAFVPTRLYHRYLGGNTFRAVLNATLLGIPLPLCSCGVIPTAMSLRKEGASKGATASFLIATPQTGIDSIIATYSLMGLPFALLRPLIALVTALLGGVLVNRLEGNECENKAQLSVDSSVFTPQKETLKQKIRRALQYAFVEMMQDIGKWLVVGLVLAGLITVFVPDSFFSYFSDQPFLSMLLVLAFAIPMYLCATGSIPIAVALMLKGLSPGTALVLLMAGPAVNVASLLVVGKVMGRRVVLVYIFTLVCCAILFGLGVDCFLPREWFTLPLQQIHGCHEEGWSYFNIGCSVLLVLLLCNAFFRRWHTSHKCQDGCACVTNQTDRWQFVVKGMSCNHCKNNVERVITRMNGVKSVEVNLTSGIAVVTGCVDKAEIRKAIQDIGFEVVDDSL